MRPPPGEHELKPLKHQRQDQRRGAEESEEHNPAGDRALGGAEVVEEVEEVRRIGYKGEWEGEHADCCGGFGEAFEFAQVADG